MRQVTATLSEIMEAWLVQLGDGRLEHRVADLEVLTEPPGARWRNLGD